MGVRCPEDSGERAGRGKGSCPGEKEKGVVFPVPSSLSAGCVSPVYCSIARITCFCCCCFVQFFVT